VLLWMAIAPYKPDQWYVWELMPINHTEMKSIRKQLESASEVTHWWKYPFWWQFNFVSLAHLMFKSSWQKPLVQRSVI
jgi:hypothetical protein